MKNNTLTVGILIGNICSAHSDSMLNGLVHRAADCNVQTLFFMGAHENCFDELQKFPIDEYALKSKEQFWGISKEFCSEE